MGSSRKNSLRNFCTISELLEVVPDVICSEKIGAKLAWLE